MAQQLILDYREASLSHEERLLCDYAIKLTLDPSTAEEPDIQRLRDAGFNDEQLTIATQVIGYFNYINRIADGLGVDDEDWMKSISHEDWHRRRGRDYLDSL